MTDRVFKALGAADEHEALRMIAEASDFMNAIKDVTGEATYAGAQAVIAADRSLTREVLTITGATERASALGSVLAFKASHEALPGVNERVKNLEEEGRKRDVAALISKGLDTGPRTELNPYAGSLTPATAKFWENEPAEKLESFLKMAPRVIPGERQQAATGAQAGKNAIGALTNAKNQTFEEMSGAEKSELAAADPELYETLRADWITRGKPHAAPKTAA